MRFGVYLPTFAWRDLRFDQAARVKEFARKAEALERIRLGKKKHGRLSVREMLDRRAQAAL